MQEVPGGWTKEQYLGTLNWQHDMKDFNYMCMADSVVHLKTETMVTSYVPPCIFFRTFLQHDKVSWSYKGLIHGRVEIRNFSSRVKKYLTNEWVIYETTEILINSLFAEKGAIYQLCNRRAMGIVSHVKVTCYFHVWRDHVSRRWTPGISLEFI